MAITTTFVGTTKEGRRIFRHSQTGGANAINSVAVTGTPGRSVIQVTTVYSGAPTQAGVTVTLNSGAGAGFDSVLNTGSANATTTNYLPTVPPVVGSDDTVTVSAPAGGGGLTSSIAVYTQEL